MKKEPDIRDYESRHAYEHDLEAWCTSQHAPGAKLDQGKIDMSLLEFLPNALREICRVMDYGQTKYSRGGFLEVPEAKQRYTSAMFRHWLDECIGLKYDEGDPFYDTEAGMPFKGKLRHDAQLAVNALFRLEVILRAEYEQDEQESISHYFTYIQTCIDEGKSYE